MNRACTITGTLVQATALIYMVTYKLNNYLRTFRKRTGLSQREVAYLLGCHDGSKISRYERFQRQPNLETALALRIIFNTPVREMFAGLGEQVEKKTLRRIGVLGRRLHTKTPDSMTEQKLEALATAVRGSSKHGG